METLGARLAQYQAEKPTTDRTVRTKIHQRKIQTGQESLETTHMERPLQQDQQEQNTSSLNNYDPGAREKAGTMTNKM